MSEVKIIDRGRGPELERIRITVFDVLPYFQESWHPSSIALWYGISSDEVLALRQYYEEHKEVCFCLEGETCSPFSSTINYPDVLVDGKKVKGGFAMVRVAVVLVAALSFPAIAVSYDWRVEVQYGKSRYDSKANKPLVRSGASILNGFKAEESIAVRAKNGEPFAAEASCNGFKISISGVVKEFPDGRVILRIEGVRKRRSGNKGIQGWNIARLVTSVQFCAKGKEGGTRIGQPLFVGGSGVTETRIRNRKQQVIASGFTYRLTKYKAVRR